MVCAPILPLECLWALRVKTREPRDLWHHKGIIENSARNIAIQGFIACQREAWGIIDLPVTHGAASDFELNNLGHMVHASQVQ